MKNLVNIYQQKFTYHPYYQKLFKQLTQIEKKVFVFVKNQSDKELDKEIYQIGFSNLEDLIQKVKELKLENSYFNTFEEHSIVLTNKLKQFFNQPATHYYQAFENKDFQREKLLEYDKSITVNYQIIEDLKKFKLEIDFPLVIKPIRWAQSRWVKIIKSKAELEQYLTEYQKILERVWESWYKNESFLLEEFIDGSAWSVDYFVDENWNFTLTKPAFLEFGIDIKLDDFCNISRVISKEKENELDLDKLKEFLEKNIKALWIKNTFVHHEFKFTNKQQFKTIEINWRIGWFRLDMYDKCYNINLLEIPFQKQPNWYLENPLQTNYAIWALYPKKEGIFKKINDKIFNQIKKLPSLESIKIINSKIGQKIWPAKNWYSRVWFVRLNNPDFQQFQKDYEFVKKNYENLLILN